MDAGALPTWDGPPQAAHLAAASCCCWERTQAPCPLWGHPRGPPETCHMLPVTPMARGQWLSCRTVRKGWAGLDALTTRFCLCVCFQVPLSKATEGKTCVITSPRHRNAGATCTGPRFSSRRLASRPRRGIAMPTVVGSEAARTRGRRQGPSPDLRVSEPQCPLPLTLLMAVGSVLPLCSLEEFGRLA